MRHITRTSGAVLIAVVVASCGDTPTSPSEVSGQRGIGSSRLDQEGGSTSLSSADHEFATFAASFLGAIVEMSRLAHASGDLPAVKMFAFQLIQDFTIAQTSLRQAAPEETRSSSLNPTDQRAYNAVAEMSGSALDRVYLTQLTQLLQAAVPRYRQEGSSGGATSLRGHASNYASELTAYLARAQELARRAGACFPGGSGSTTVCGSRTTAARTSSAH
jgi:predicted outer membrane protein